MSDYTLNKCDCGRTIETEKQYSCDECFKTNRKADLLNVDGEPISKEELFFVFTDAQLLEYIKVSHKERFINSIKDYIRVYFPNIKGLNVEYKGEDEILSISFEPNPYGAEEVQRKLYDIIQYVKR
jgi:hypothetical protein